MEGLTHTQKDRVTPTIESEPTITTVDSFEDGSKIDDSVKRVRSILATLRSQETTLKNIFACELTKAGLGKEHIEKFIPLSNVNVRLATKKEQGIHKCADCYQGNIQILADTSLEGVRDSVGKQQDIVNAPLSEDAEDRYLFMEILQSVAHEELHALTTTAIHREQTNDLISHVTQITERGSIGFAQDKRVTTQNMVSGERMVSETTQVNGINEAITQLISLRIAGTFLKQNPFPGISNETQDYYLQEPNIGYTREMLVAEQYIALISVLSDISEDMILNGLFREYVHNKTPVPDVFAELICSHIPDITTEQAEWVTTTLRSDLAENKFSKNSSFYEMFLGITKMLPKEKQEVLWNKLHLLEDKYLGTEDK